MKATLPNNSPLHSNSRFLLWTPISCADMHVAEDPVALAAPPPASQTGRKASIQPRQVLLHLPGPFTHSDARSMAAMGAAAQRAVSAAQAALAVAAPPGGGGGGGGAHSSQPPKSKQPHSAWGARVTQPNHLGDVWNKMPGGGGGGGTQQESCLGVELWRTVGILAASCVPGHVAWDATAAAIVLPSRHAGCVALLSPAVASRA